MQYGGGGTVESSSESIFVGTIGFEYGWLLEDINENGGGGDGLGKPPQIPRSKARPSGSSGLKFMRSKSYNTSLSSITELLEFS